MLFIHGTADESVPLSEMNCLAEWSGQKGRAIYDANHTFGTREPWADKKMSKALEEVCRHTAHFLLQSHSFQKI